MTSQLCPVRIWTKHMFLKEFDLVQDRGGRSDDITTIAILCSS